VAEIVSFSWRRGFSQVSAMVSLTALRMDSSLMRLRSVDTGFGSWASEAGAGADGASGSAGGSARAETARQSRQTASWRMGRLDKQDVA